VGGVNPSAGATALELPPLPLARQRFAVVDVETSGLSVKRHRVLQLAVVSMLGDGTVVDRWTTDVRALRVGPRRIHGITRRRAWRAPSFAVVAPELVRRLDGTVVVAHHARFDWAFLGRALRRAGVEAPAGGQLCTLQLSRSLDPDRERRHGLSDLCERYGVARGQQHDALADAEATARVLPKLLAEAGIIDGTMLQEHLVAPGAAG
jgi:DNA polymerase III epsilon subunit-like protein